MERVTEEPTAQSDPVDGQDRRRSGHEQQRQSPTVPDDDPARRRRSQTSSTTTSSSSRPRPDLDFRQPLEASSSATCDRQRNPLASRNETHRDQHHSPPSSPLPPSRVGGGAPPPCSPRSWWPSPPAPARRPPAPGSVSARPRRRSRTTRLRCRGPRATRSPATSWASGLRPAGGRRGAGGRHANLNIYDSDAPGWGAAPLDSHPTSWAAVRHASSTMRFAHAGRWPTG